MTDRIRQSADGWFFNHLQVETPRSSFALDGRVERGELNRMTEVEIVGVD